MIWDLSGALAPSPSTCPDDARREPPGWRSSARSTAARRACVAALALFALACTPGGDRGARADSAASGAGVGPNAGGDDVADDAEADDSLTAPDDEALIVPAWAPDFQGDTAKLDLADPWWALRMNAGAFTLARRPVTLRKTRDVCEEDESASAPGLPRITVADSSVVLLFSGVDGLQEGPVVTGRVLGRAAHDILADPNDFVGAPSDSARAVFRADTLRFVGAPHGEGGFRVELTSLGASQVLYSADAQDEGGWSVRWVGDLNRDDLPDVLLDATNKYSVDVTLLYLSERRDGKPAWQEAAAYEHVGC
jgi:hypothetical protein